MLLRIVKHSLKTQKKIFIYRTLSVWQKSKNVQSQGFNDKKWIFWSSPFVTYSDGFAWCKKREQKLSRLGTFKSTPICSKNFHRVSCGIDRDETPIGVVASGESENLVSLQYSIIKIKVSYRRLRLRWVLLFIFLFTYSIVFLFILLLVFAAKPEIVTCQLSHGIYYF
jgi:hypothetical protein